MLNILDKCNWNGINILGASFIYHIVRYYSFQAINKLFCLTDVHTSKAAVFWLPPACLVTLVQAHKNIWKRIINAFRRRRRRRLQIGQVPHLGYSAMGRPSLVMVAVLYKHRHHCRRACPVCLVWWAFMPSMQCRPRILRPAAARQHCLAADSRALLVQLPSIRVVDTMDCRPHRNCIIITTTRTTPHPPNPVAAAVEALAMLRLHPIHGF